MQHANNKDTYQLAHSSSLTSTFVVHCLDSIIPILNKSKISRLYLASVSEQASLSLTWSQTSLDRLSRDVAQMSLKEFQGSSLILLYTCFKSIYSSHSSLHGAWLLFYCPTVSFPRQSSGILWPVTSLLDHYVTDNNCQSTGILPLKPI